jgi:hypothetical protein
VSDLAATPGTRRERKPVDGSDLGSALQTVGGIEVDAEFVLTHFAACTVFRAAHADGPCDDCGWLEAEHLDLGVEAHLAEVLAGPMPAPALRRAS